MDVQSGTVRRPARLVISAVLVLVLMLGLLAAVGVMVIAMVGVEQDIDPLLIIPLAVIVPALGWMGWLVWTLLTGRRRSRFALVITAIASAPFYLFFIFDTGQHHNLFDPSSTLGLVRLGGFVVCSGDLLVTVAAALLLIGPGVTRYLRRPTPRAAWPGVR